MKKTILILGACGQIGTELTQELRTVYGNDRVIASDIRQGDAQMMYSGPFEILDVTDSTSLLKVVQKYEITQVYLMAAMLSATAEKHPQKAWNLNMNPLLSVLDLAKEKYIKQIFWPSSIAVFGQTSPKVNTPQQTLMDPATVYGISKVSGEYWCNYYHKKFGVDVRSIRFPGLISWKTPPGGGTTDYAVAIFFKALTEGAFRCFLSAHTRLPMMYMEDAIKATLKLMDAKSNRITVRTAYNLSGISFTPQEIADQIKKNLPDFSISYHPDFRQAIAETWPESVDDSQARQDWGWKSQFDLASITKMMIENIRNKKREVQSSSQL